MPPTEPQQGVWGLFQAFDSALDAVSSTFYASSGLGPFVLEDGPVLGEGGYGKVVPGQNSKTGERVAIKVIDGTSAGKSAAANVVKEVAVMKRVGGHDFVVKLHGYYERKGLHYIVMDLLPGGELFSEVLKKGSIPEERCRSLFAQMLAGLHHIHCHGVAHRDLKLENVLYDAEGRLKWVDFGLAHSHKPNPEGAGYVPEALTQFCGSPSYTAPEIMARAGYNGFVADIWSLGVCLFAMVTGFFPLEEASPADWRFAKLARVQHDGHSTTHKIFEFYRRDCFLSAELVKLLDGMLQLDPRRRLSLRSIACSPWVYPALEALYNAPSSSSTAAAAVPSAPEQVAGEPAGRGALAAATDGADGAKDGPKPPLDEMMQREVDLLAMEVPTRGCSTALLADELFSALPTCVEDVPAISMGSVFSTDDLEFDPSEELVYRSVAPPAVPSLCRQRARSQLPAQAS